MSASGRTMNGACPPNSRVICFTVSALCRKMICPTAVDPVKVTFRTAGDFINGTTTSSGAPNRRFTAPSGRPASWQQATRAATLAGASSAGRTITEQPAARAADTFRAASMIGKFQAVRANTTPIG